MFNLAKKLISIPSETGNEQAICNFLVTYLRENGMEVQEQEVTPGRRNIYAYFPDHKPRFLFNTHIDTVPPQYGPQEDDEYIYGRGACDTDGIIAPLLEAIFDLHENGIDDTGLLFVVGEEQGHDGALAAAKHFPEPEFLVVCEPTDNKLALGGKGILRLRLTSHGVSGHSGYPEKCDSAIHKLIDILLELKLDIDGVPKDPILGNTLLNIGTISGGVAHNVVAEEAQCELFYRLTENYDRTMERVEGILNKENARNYHPSCNKNFTWKWTDRGNPITLSTLPNFETCVVAFGTDIPFFNWKNAKTFLIGPGSCLVAHKAPAENTLDGEYISKNEMVEAVDLYKKLVKSLK
jgi:acetylornithine deacetylase